MMRTLVSLEWRRLTRGARAQGLTLLLGVATLGAAGLGSALALGHTQAAATDLAAARERQAAMFAQGSALVEVAHWSDTAVARTIPPLAALSAGDLAALPDAATVRLGEAPQLVPARAERSPASALLGTFDVIWLLSLLMPLAVLGLAYDRVARDRSRGHLAMLLAFAPSPTGLLLARTGAVAGLIGLGVLPGLALGMVGAALSMQGSLPIVDGLCVLVLCGAAILAWSAVFIALSAHASRPAQALSMGLALWAAWTLVLPLALSALGQLAYPDPDPRAELEALEASRALATKDADRWVQQESLRSPELDPEKAVDGVESNLRFDLLLARAQLRRSRGAQHGSRRAVARRAELARLSAYLSPSTLVSHGLASLAGTDPEARTRFEAWTLDFQDRLDAAAAARLRDHHVKAGRPEDWPPRYAPPHADRAPALIGTGLLLALAGLCLGLARARLVRGPLDPSPQQT